MINGDRQRPPKHLRPETKAWWDMAVAVRRFKNHELRILLVACETLDRRTEAREALKKFGLTFTDSKGIVRQRPEVCIERDCSAAFLRTVRTLHLDPPPRIRDIQVKFLGTKRSGSNGF